MSGGKGLLGRVAVSLSHHFGFPKARKSLGRKVEKTRSDSLDRGVPCDPSPPFPWAAVRFVASMSAERKT